MNVALLERKAWNGKQGSLTDYEAVLGSHLKRSKVHHSWSTLVAFGECVILLEKLLYARR